MEHALSTRILVTGSAGFMGSHIVNKLRELGFTDVYGLDDLSGGLMENVKESELHKFYKIDLSDATLTEQFIERIKPEVIFHLAASAREGASQFQPRYILNTNYEAYVNLLVPAIKHGLKKMVMFSSMAVYGKQALPYSETSPRLPVDVYGINKASMEHTTEILSGIYGFQYSIIRPHNVMGVSQRLTDKFRNCVAIFMNRIMRGEPLFIYGDGKQTRAFSGIEYSINCYIEAMKLNSNEIFNIGGKYPISINRVAKEVCEAMGEDPTTYKIIHLDDRPLEVKHAFTTFTKSENILGYQEPEDGWQKTIWSMAKWAKTKGPQEWTTEELELVNEKTPKTWLKDFDPLTFK